MESANLHHQHQLQDQLVGSSSLATTPSWYGVTSSHAWTPNNNNTLNNSDNFNHNINGDLCNSTDSRHKDDHTLVVPPLNSPNIIQDLAFNWTNNNAGMISCFTTAHPAHDHHLHLAKTKDELSLSADFNFPKFTHMINSSPSSSIEDLYHLPPASYIKDEQNGGFFYNAQNCSRFGGVSILPSRGNFSSHMILPSINVSDLSQSSCPISSSLEMNLQALDLLTSARFGCTTLSQPSHDNLGQLAKESLLFAPHQMQQPVHSRPASSPSKISPFMNGVTEVKRPSRTMMEPKASQAATKKSRLESRACPPFKVRKEKLGDRIATLQQLVAPFGKTDTASVLMEAIGYIKFLQNQVETLSVPYMKSSRNNKTHRSTQPIKIDHQDQGNEEPKRDLKGRGLCLVPLSCMSYVTSDSAGGGIWPDYHGGT